MDNRYLYYKYELMLRSKTELPRLAEIYQHLMAD